MGCLEGRRGRDPIDVICLTPEEFAQASQRITLIQAVLPDAIDLLSAEPATASATSE